MVINNRNISSSLSLYYPGITSQNFTLVRELYNHRMLVE
jgi:hypothetical protein